MRAAELLCALTISVWAAEVRAADPAVTPPPIFDPSCTPLTVDVGPAGTPQSAVATPRHASIKAALDDIASRNPCGATIRVEDGTYADQLVVRNNVAIVAVHSGRAHVTGSLTQDIGRVLVRGIDFAYGKGASISSRSGRIVLEHVTVREVLANWPPESGTAVDISGGAMAWLVDSAMERKYGPGLLVSGVGTKMYARNVSVGDCAQAPPGRRDEAGVPGIRFGAIDVSGGAAFYGMAVTVTAGVYAGVYVHDGAVAHLRDLRIEGTPGSAGMIYHGGLIVRERSVVELDGFNISGDRCGIELQGKTAFVSAFNGELAHNRFALCATDVAPPPYDAERCAGAGSRGVRAQHNERPDILLSIVPGMGWQPAPGVPPSQPVTCPYVPWN